MESGNTILIVDDSAGNRESLKALLEGAGHLLLEAEDGAAALTTARTTTLDLVLLDVMMPDMDGFEVCRRLRADPGLSEIPVLLVTALDDRASRLAGIDAGADDFITKPFDRIELALRIKSILRLNRYRRLMSERDRFQKLFDLSPDGILIMDDKSRIVMANPSLKTLFGAGSETMIQGRNLMDLVACEQIPRCLDNFARLMAGGEDSIKDETWFRRLDGTFFPVEIHAARFQWEGTAAAQLLIRDITKRRDNARLLAEAVEAERRSLAIELHDEFGQVLTGLKMTLEQATDAEPVRRSRNEVDRLLQKVRNLSLNLRPSMLDELGLLPALESLFDRIGNDSGLKVDFKGVNADRRLPRQLETVAYRVVQEALTNVARHSGTNEAAVRLWVNDDELGIQVEDQGCGFDLATVRRARASVGLSSMQDRVAGLGGDLQLNAAPDAGTSVVATLPLREPAEAKDAGV